MGIYNKRQQEIGDEIETGLRKTGWKNWKWHIRHAVKDVATFEQLTGISFDEGERDKLEKTIALFPISITPYYLSLIDETDYQNDPIFRQSFPDPQEVMMEKFDMRDPLHEDSDSPVEGITHRYPDRVLFLVSNICSMYCRHCTRKRKVGDLDCIPDKAIIRKGLDYIRKTPQVRDVLLSGGDPLMLSDNYLDWILGELRTIPHVEIIRLGTRMPVVLPYRITGDLIDMLKSHQPLWINTHFNHPREITDSSKESLQKLADGGFPLGNQSVLLAGVNDCPRIIRQLVHQLVQNRVRPYYLYQCDLSEGLAHLRTPVGKGMEIIESLIGHTSGFAVPTYVIDAPGGGGKIPIMPNYIISWSTNKVILRNYQGVITTYQEPESYVSNFCDRKCKKCNLQLNIHSASEYRAQGIERLLSDQDDTIALSPVSSVSYNQNEEPIEKKEKIS
jgi:lysine 2,3-aminomutase